MTDYENEAYESANEAVLFCVSYLSEKRERTATLYLEGLDSICDQATARVARARLSAAWQKTNDKCAKHLLTAAFNAVERALGTPVLLAAS